MWRATLVSTTDPHKECKVLISKNKRSLVRKAAELFEKTFIDMSEYKENKEIQKSWELWKQHIDTLDEFIDEDEYIEFGNNEDIWTQNKNKSREFVPWVSHEKKSFSSDYTPFGDLHLMSEYFSTYDFSVYISYESIEDDVLVTTIFEH